MITRPDFARFARWEREWQRTQPVDYRRNLKIYEALYEEAVGLGVLPSNDPLANIDVDIRLARALNVRTTPR